ncbi:MAG: hypothetical protein A3C84_03350 [Candidatus Ryanbacteria bacterium RIFCSPHIGHO2_02_FULL_48_12]|uniref:Uncharacterized protein n=1 Tax=Candidatus Ryanbacteria bacterium RIFCSPHIGHO2_01_FULL_48_27 TaxID=1802115 RepID=A0A1G2FZE0_9BACT|nr:MAG: hypothetical protein A2756_00035 [Candidatus Ryanbacteria bacterium RIFCSPHIGHO2_01_FULL_48_27]OGZ49969.1 MAG: hypothetical protein A3C84_03350 [Candidatus Ryanbacteria bacterium RIFCSPHIGHO2_02_FULL_48_12]
MGRATRKKNEKSIQQAMHTPPASSRSVRLNGADLGCVCIGLSLDGGDVCGMRVGIVCDTHRHTNYKNYDCYPNDGAVAPVLKVWHMRLLLTIYL